MMLVDVLVNGCRKIIPDRIPFSNATSDLTRGDLKQRRIHIMDLGTDSWQLAFQFIQICLFVWTTHHADPVAGVYDFLWLMPLRQFTQRIATDDGNDICVRVLFCNQLDRIKRVMWTWSIQL